MMTVKQHNLDMQQAAAEYQAIIDERDSEMEMLKAEHAYAIDQANKKVAAMQNPRGREKHQPAKRQFWELFCPQESLDSDVDNFYESMVPKAKSNANLSKSVAVRRVQIVRKT